jgi:methylated-DNA-[protein]-cysteine S-methyltransferase
MKTPTCFQRIDSPLGPMLAVASGDALKVIDFEDARGVPTIAPHWIADARQPLLRACARQLAEYFAGERAGFDLPLAPDGTPFQQAIWTAIRTVPAGATITYRELAARAGRPDSIRAAGTATGRNPLAIVIPCHRIIGSDGSLTGYAGGLERKRSLLALEAKFAPVPRLAPAAGATQRTLFADAA